MTRDRTLLLWFVGLWCAGIALLMLGAKYEAGYLLGASNVPIWLRISR